MLYWRGMCADRRLYRPVDQGSQASAMDRSLKDRESRVTEPVELW